MDIKYFLIHLSKTKGIMLKDIALHIDNKHICNQDLW